MQKVYCLFILYQFGGYLFLQFFSLTKNLVIFISQNIYKKPMIEYEC